MSHPLGRIESVRHATLAAGARIGFYEIVGPIGAGGMGEVYRAHDSKLGRDVAIKVLPQAFAADPDRLARFEREARLLAALNHPNIAQIHGLDESDGVLALVMELVDGETLADRIARGPVPLAEALPIARQIAEALAAAHEQGIIHRDLKPANVKVRPDASVKVLDFGLAKWSEPATAAHAMNSPTLSARSTQQGLILGTAAYMSPEQATGKPVDRRTDLWSFGVVLFEMLTGRRVFEGESVSHVIAAVLKDEPDWTSLPLRTPAPIRQLLRNCLEKDPRNRLDSARAARLDIDDALSLRTDSDIGATAPLLRRSSRRPAALVLYGLVATVAAIAFGYRAAHLSDRSELRVTTLALPAPEGTSLDTLAVSPNGEMIAFTAADVTGRTVLWLRSLGSAEPRRLVESTSVIFPFWSPDSRFVAYASKGFLWKVAVDGGPPQALCPVTAERGATWGLRGDIVFSPTGTTLQRVSADGGTPTPLTSLDLSHGESSHRWPAFLPDGRHYVFTVRSTQPDNRGVWLGEIGSDRRSRLLPDLTNAQYVPTRDGQGVLLFVRGSSLLAQHLDISSARITGDPVTLASRVSMTVAWTFADFSASERLLAYATTAGPRWHEQAWLDRTGRRIGSTEFLAGVSSLSLSRDERRLLISALDWNTGVDKLWLLDLRRGAQSRFTREDVEAQKGGIWSPDGQRMAFIESNRIVIADADGTNRVFVPKDLDRRFEGRQVILNDWSPDGRVLLATVGTGQRSELWAIPASAETGATPASLTAGIATADSGRFSPDGKWIAYDIHSTTGGCGPASVGCLDRLSDDGDASLQSQVYLQPFSTTHSGGRVQISTRGGATPRWNPDGNELFYFAIGRTKLMSAKLHEGRDPDQPTVAFELPYVSIRNDFVVADHGRRFLTSMPPSKSGEPAAVVLNWTAALAGSR
jgi:Tol biopolymer transport system component